MALRQSIQHLALLSAILIMPATTMQSADPAGPRRIVFNDACADELTLQKSGLAPYLKEIYKRRGYTGEEDYVTAHPSTYGCDVNGDGALEYFVPFSCGSGGCSFLLLAANPPRMLGEVDGDTVWFEPVANSWPIINGLSRSGCSEANVFKYEYCGGHYAPTDEYILYEQSGCAPGDVAALRKKIGPITCGKAKG